MLEQLAVPGPIAPTVGRRASAGFLGGILGGGLNLLNYTTFYAMKERSAVVGAAGLAPLLSAIARPGLRLHLAGHSFGARLVSAATKALPAGTTVASMALLQGAFSHFGFAADWDLDTPGPQSGLFRSDVADQRVTGPVLITHTANDLAVGIAYAVASRLANQIDVVDRRPRRPFRRPRAQRRVAHRRGPAGHAAAGRRRLPVAAAPAAQPARRRVRRDHSDVKGREVAYALLSAAATT